MKTAASVALSLFAALTLPAAAQTKTPAKSTAKPVAKPTAKPAAKPAPATVPAPAAPKPAAASAAEPLIPEQGAVSFKKGTTAVNLGVGLGAGYGYNGFGIGGNFSATPALSLSVEKGIIDNVGPGVISVGGLVGYRRDHYEYSYSNSSYEANWHNLVVMVRGAYHYNFTTDPKLDTYAGLSLGARMESYSNSYDEDVFNNSYGGAYLTSGIFLGGRYLFTDTIGAFAEAGYDMSFLKLGLTAKF